MNYGKIAVLAGGASNEREISLKSGRAVYDALKKRVKSVDFVDVKSTSGEGLEGLSCDVAFLCLHGRFGEDGTLQAILDELSIAYTGSGPRPSQLAMDKLVSKEVFTAEGLRVPGYRMVGRGSASEWPSDLAGQKATLVVKPRCGGSSIGLSIVRDKKELIPALEKAFRHGDEAIIEEYIEGRELAVGMLDMRALPVIEIAAKNNVYDFDAKYSDGETKYVLPAKLEEDDYKRVQGCALKAHRVLGCRDFSRVDMRMDRLGKLYILEVNTIPGLTKRSLLPKAALAEGVAFEDLCIELIDMAYKRRKKEYVEEKAEQKSR